ncbi:MAG TPA: Uma2 family endonuclease [Candidatus Ozemobacteraceae bacterium]|nr:Uma2 family endonuclease [Candidatus Ozemobacteraceae bacterium]
MEAGMSDPKEIPTKTYTYADYCTWTDDKRFELIDGIPYDMTPAPGTLHQTLVGKLYRFLDEFFEGKRCKAFVAPVDVRLPKGDESDDEVNTVVQPDVIVVCDETKIDAKGCRKAPDLVIEVLSFSTASRDQIKKRALYERHGVKEYWIVHPDDRLVYMYRRLPDGRFGPADIVAAETESGTPVTLSTPLFPDLAIDLGRVFPPLPPRVIREGPPRYL